MQYDFTTNICIDVAEFCADEVQASFDVDADLRLSLRHATLGGLTLTREQVLTMVGPSDLLATELQAEVDYDEALKAGDLNYD